MNGMRRLGISLVLGLMLAVLFTSAALAFDCNNPNIDFCIAIKGTAIASIFNSEFNSGILNI